MKLQDLKEGEENKLAKKLRPIFIKHKMFLLGTSDHQKSGGFERFIIKGGKHFTAGTKNELKFIIQCTIDENHEFIDGTVHAQSYSGSKKYDLDHNLDEDDYTLDEFAERVNTFISGIIKKERDAYAEGLSDYVAKGGRGMMPGDVHRDYKK